MPVERVSRGFKDISMSFEVNPINNDIIGVKNDTAIARSIRNLVFTVPGERFFNEDLGSKVSQVLFDTVDDISAASIKDEIEETIIKYEPRVELKDIRVEPDFDNHNFNVTIVYDVVGIDEAQFFDSHLIKMCKKLANKNTRVIVAGLDSDYRGSPFGPMPDIMCESDYLDKLTAICVTCGNPASFTQRITEQLEQVVIGETDIYEARCRNCFEPPKK